MSNSQITEPVFVRTVYVDDSTNVNRLKYDIVSRTLEIQFKNGKCYRYFAVTPAKFGTLCAADSVGKAFDAIKAMLGEAEEV